jgi:hypothetical protein
MMRHDLLLVALVTLTFLALVWSRNSKSPNERRLSENWQVLPPSAPALIETEEDLSAIKRFISPIMTGGLGNMMFGLAAAHAVAKQVNAICIVAWWDQLRSTTLAKTLPYHGRGDPAPNITIKHIFPNLHYVSFYPRTRHVTAHAFGTDSRTYIPPSEELLTFQTPYMKGEYFQLPCTSSISACSTLLLIPLRLPPRARVLDPPRVSLPPCHARLCRKSIRAAVWRSRCCVCACARRV